MGGRWKSIPDQSLIGMTTSPNSEYANLDAAFQFFNDKLFADELPGVLVTIHNHPRAKGFFRRGAFSQRGNSSVTTDEICLCPDANTGRSDLDILSTLVHEMVHLWQYHLGDAPRRCYHDREFASKMEEVGLMPSDTGMVGGRRTGQSMTHYVIEGGAFEVACCELLAGGWKLQWEEASVLSFDLTGGIGGATNSGKAKPTRRKFVCSKCGMAAQAKLSAKLKCGQCDEAMV